MEGTVQRTETTFESLLGGMSVDEFRSRYQGKEWLRVRAVAPPAAHLIEWSELNTELGKLRAVGTRIKMVRRAVPIPRPAFCYGDGGRINSGAVQALLNAGATLIVNVADDIFPNVRDLVAEIETALEASVWANLYLGFKHEPGFALHWDSHDTLIVQVSGRKRWQVYSRTVPWPIKTENGNYRTPCPVPTEDQLLWRGDLMEGDMLYMPRGFWHDATPLDEPSMHITIGIRRPTLRMLLKWYLDTSGEEVVRQDLPYDGNFETSIALFTEGLNRAAQRHAGASSLAASFMDWWNSKGIPRPRFDLPVSDRRGIRSLHLQTPRPLRKLGETNGHVDFTANGRRWSVPREVWAQLEALAPGSAVTPGEGSDGARHFDGRHKNIYLALVAGGVLAAERR